MFYKKFKNPINSWSDFWTNLKLTFYHEWLRLFIVCLIAFGALFKYWYCSHYYGVKDEHWYHVFLEFLGVAFIFLIVEYSVRKLDSGISDPERLPLKKFIGQIATGENSLILFDTALESILLEYTSTMHNEFEKNLTNVLNKNPNFNVQILLISLASDFIEERAKQRNIKDADIYKRNCEKSTQNLKIIRDKIIRDIPNAHGRIIIKEYSETPPFAMYSIDESAYISFYPEGIKTTDARQLYIPNESSLGKLIFQFYDKVFEEIWKDAKEI